MDSLLMTTELPETSKLVYNKTDYNAFKTNFDVTTATKANATPTTLMPTKVDFIQSIAPTERLGAQKDNRNYSCLNRCSSQKDSTNAALIPCSNSKLPAQKPTNTHSATAENAATKPTKVQLTPKPNEYPEVRNVIVSANLGCKLDLRYIAMHAKNVEYNPKLRDVLLMRIRRPFCLAFIYSSGKLICTGTKSCLAARAAARKFARVIQKLGIPIRFARSKVENIIASCKLSFRIRLEALELFQHKHCIYEPELFPSLVYRLPRLDSQVFVFSSGAIVLCNIRKMSRIQETFLKFYSIVKPFKRI